MWSAWCMTAQTQGNQSILSWKGMIWSSGALNTVHGSICDTSRPPNCQFWSSQTRATREWLGRTTYYRSASDFLNYLDLDLDNRYLFAAWSLLCQAQASPATESLRPSRSRQRYLSQTCHHGCLSVSSPSNLEEKLLQNSWNNPCLSVGSRPLGCCSTVEGDY